MRRQILIGYILLLILATYLLYEAWQIVPMAYDRIRLYRWVGLGLGISLLANFAIKRSDKKPRANSIARKLGHNLDFIKTFTHELSHTLVGLMAGRKIVSFNAKRQEGVVWSQGGGFTATVFSSLAPYCLPYFTFALLLIWSLIATRTIVFHDGLIGLDILIGISLGLHFSCFWDQTGSYQPDINQFPLSFSYLFIWTFRLLNILIILVTFLPTKPRGGDPYRIWGACWYLIKNFFLTIYSWF